MVSLIFMPGVSSLGDIPWFFFSFGGITGCGSASLKMCICGAASSWSQGTSQDKQCGGNEAENCGGGDV